MYLDYLDKYKGMEPYLHIPKEDWTYIKTTFAIEDVKEKINELENQIINA